jgi:hypothetical protein
VCLFTNCATPITVGYGYNSGHPAIDVAPDGFDNSAIIGIGVNALYDGTLHFSPNTNYSALLITGGWQYEITYSHVDFSNVLTGRGDPNEAYLRQVNAGEQIGVIMDINLDNENPKSDNAPNHLHISIRSRTPQSYFPPYFLLSPQ